MANPTTANDCLRKVDATNPSLKEIKSTPAWWAYCIGGSGTVNVYFFDELGEIEGSAQTITVAAETGIMGLPGIVFPVDTQPAQGIAETLQPRAIWMEVIAVSGALTWGLYGTNRDMLTTGTFLKAGSHRSYKLAVGASLRLGPCPHPQLGVNGALDVDDLGNQGVLFTNGTFASPATTGIVKASAASLKSCMCSNLNTSVRYLQFFDQTAALGGGETPVLSLPLLPGTGTVPTLEVFDVNYFGGGAGHAFSTGLVYGISTTLATYTAAAASDHLLEGYYI